MSKRPKRTYYSTRSFITYMMRYRLRLFVTAIIFAISDIMLALLPLFIGKLVGELAAAPPNGHQAVIYTWVLIGLSTGHNLTWRLGEIVYMKLINPLNYRYENILFRQVIQKPYPFFVDKFTGKLSSYVGSITQDMRSLTETVFYNYINQAVSITAVAFILASVNLATGLIFTIGMLGMFLVGRHTLKNSTKYEKIAADVLSTKNGKITDAIANFVNVKSFQKESVETASIEKEQDKTVKAASDSFKWSIFFWGTMSFFVRDFIWPATIGLNVYLFLHGQITIAQLSTILSTVLIFSSTIWEIIWHVSQFNLKRARTEEAHRYLFGESTIAGTGFEDFNAEPQTFESSLSLADLNFAYPDKPDTNVLDAITLTVNKGEKVGIVGKSGSGKTTLTKLLLGYYPAEPGEIRLDGQDVDTRDLASCISYVPQDTSLFHRSIAENIAYATDKKVARDEITAAAKRAHADEFIQQISDGYDAMVGERGVKLSAGQRQRIAIARAFLDDKPILILDEATSALDSESEVLVQEGLEALWENKTVLAIAHRLSTLRHMDTIIVMDKGKIIERGNHNELLKQNGAYAKLWAHQSGGFLEE